MSGEIRIWQLTELGSRAARNPNNPDSSAYKIIGYLDWNGTGTIDQISSGTGCEYGEVSSTMYKLQRLGIVKEITSVEQDNKIRSH